MLLVMKPCPCWTGSAPQFALKQTALLLQSEAEVREGTGEVTEGAHQRRRVVKLSAYEDEVLEEAIPMPPKCTQPPNQVLLGTVEHLKMKQPGFSSGRALGD